MKDLAQTYFHRIRRAAATKYFLVLLIAGIWMLFFDRYNLIAQYRMEARIESLQADLAHYQRALEQVEAEQDRLQGDPEALERYAREKYFMKKAGEEVFVVVEE
ncbi:MAG: septum formation initiator family protein [Bacteroidetes bacterium]|nr:MAG: septum formation initiator family protein [Bacteroidota bacterium]